MCPQNSNTARMVHPQNQVSALRVKVSRGAPLKMLKKVQNGTQQDLNRMIDLLNLEGQKDRLHTEKGGGGGGFWNETQQDLNKMVDMVKFGGGGCVQMRKWRAKPRRIPTDSQRGAVGYMPLILAPVHQMGILNTVCQRCQFVLNNIGQNYVVLTTTQASYSQLLKLKWTKRAYHEFLIVRIGRLHWAMDLMKVIGQYMQSSGV